MTTMVGTANMVRHGRIRTCTGEAAVAGVGKNIMLLLAAPFIGLAYVIVVPFVGTAAILKLAVRSLS